MPTNLTAADLDALGFPIRGEWFVVPPRPESATADCALCNENNLVIAYIQEQSDAQAIADIVNALRKERDEARTHAERADSRAEVAIAMRAVTLAQRDEARTLVEALVPYAISEAMYERVVCDECGYVGDVPESIPHAPNCTVGRAEKARDAWKGEGNE